MTWGDLAKPSRTARKKEQLEARKDRRATERSHKAAARKRDHYRCRFPLCGCRTLGLRLEARLEVSHDRHKGSGGNPAGDRSLRHMLITLCLHRHQDGIVSRHKGTLRTRALSAKKNDGPVAWEVRRSALPVMTVTCAEFMGMSLRWTEWIEVARERDVQQLEVPMPWQQRILESLAEMDL
jgi:hypothetical protein